MINISKAKSYIPTIIAVIMLILTIALFFIPFFRLISVSKVDFQSLVWTNFSPFSSIAHFFDYKYELQNDPNNQLSTQVINSTINQINVYVALVIISFIIAIIFSIICIFLAKSKPYILIGHLFYPISIIGCTIYYDVIYKLWIPRPELFVGFYVAIFIIIALVCYVILYKLQQKGSLHFTKPSFPTRPHKPTQAERIAELERQVAQLRAASDEEDI